jgi:hypothetical protein
MQRSALGPMRYILCSLSRWGQVGVAPPAPDQAFALPVLYRMFKSSARSRIAAADVANATAATARSAAATTDAGDGAASAARSAATGGTTRDAAAATARSAATGGTTGSWCCGRRR